MPDCLTCEHSNVLHTGDSTACSVPGCACDQLHLNELTPDVPPPCPGTCLHMHGDGSVWLLEEPDEVHSKLEETIDFATFTACDFEGPEQEYCTWDFYVRPGGVVSFHRVPEKRWDLILKNKA